MDWKNDFAVSEREKIGWIIPAQFVTFFIYKLSFYSLRVYLKVFLLYQIIIFLKYLTKVVKVV